MRRLTDSMPHVSSVLAAVAVAATFGVSACSEAEEITNAGGDTQCNEYLGQDSDTQRVTVTKFLKERSDGDEPAGDQVDGTMTAIDLLCRVQANAAVPIKNADLSGILIRR